MSTIALRKAASEDRELKSQEGLVYLATYRDADDGWLDGGTNYTLTVPAAEFWSLTAYGV